MIKPNVFDFKDSNLFFRSMVDYLRDKDQFSNRNFAKSLRLKSHSLVPMLYYGNRKISLKMVSIISKAFELDFDEQSYFYLLVKLEHSSNTPEVSIINKKMERLKRKRGFKIKSLPDDSDFFSSWIYPLVYVSIPLKRGLLDRSYLSAQLRIGEVELSKAIQKLLELNLVDANQNGLKRNFHFIKRKSEDHRATQYSLFKSIWSVLRFLSWVSLKAKPTLQLAGTPTTLRIVLSIVLIFKLFSHQDSLLRRADAFLT